MGIVRKQSILTLVYSYTGVIVGYLSWGLLLPLLLLPVQFGLLKFIRDTSVFISKLSQVGAMSSIVKFFPHFEKDVNDRNRFYTFALTYLFGGFSVVVVILLVFSNPILKLYAEKSPLLGDYYLYVIPFIVAFTLIDVLFVFFAIHKKPSTSFFLRDVLLRVFVLGLVGVLYLKLIDFDFFLVLFLILHFVIAVLHYITFKSRFGLRLQRFKLKPFRAKGFFEFSIYNFSSSLMGIFVKYIDSLMIVFYLGLEFNGIYGLAFLIASIIDYPRAAMISNVAPQISKLIKQDDYKKIEELNKRSGTTLLVVACFLFLIIAINTRQFLSLLDPIFLSGISVVFWIGASRVIRLATGMSYDVLINSNHYRKNLFVTLFTLILVVSTNVILIPILGIEGAAIGSFISILCTNLLIVYIVKKKLNVSTFVTKNILALVLTATLLTPFFIFDLSIEIDQHRYINFGVNAILRTVVAGGLFWLIILKTKLADDLSELFNLSLSKISRRR